MKTVTELNTYPEIGFDTTGQKLIVSSVTNKEHFAVKVTLGKESVIVKGSDLEKAIKNALK